MRTIQPAGQVEGTVGDIRRRLAPVAAVVAVVMTKEVKTVTTVAAVAMGAMLTGEEA